MALIATILPWSTVWDTSGFKDFGLFTVAGPLALTSVDTGSVIEGSSEATIVADGTNIPTFDGVAHPSYNNTAGAKNAVTVQRIGFGIDWIVTPADQVEQANTESPSSGQTTSYTATTANTGTAGTVQQITVTPSGTLFGSGNSMTVTAHDSLGATLGSPVTFNDGSATPQTISFLPTAVGSHVLSFTHTGNTGNSTTDASNETVTVSPSFTGTEALSGPNSGTTGVASSNFSAVCTSLSGTDTITPTCAGGTCSPSSISAAAGTNTYNFTVTPSYNGTHNVSISSANGATVSGSPISYVSTGGAGGTPGTATGMTHRMLPPVLGNGSNPCIVNGRTYSAAGGVEIDAPAWDASVLEANGWINTGKSGPTTGRPTGIIRAGYTYYDTTIGVNVVWDGGNWRGFDGSVT